MPGYSGSRDEHLARLRRIEGQVRGIQKMVEDDRYCIDVLTQVASVTKALQGVAMGLLDEHMRHCVRDGGDEKLDEAMSAVERLLRT